MFFEIHLDQYPIHKEGDFGSEVEMWVEIQVEMLPLSLRTVRKPHHLAHRWLCEVSARRIGDWGVPYWMDKTGSVWNHYYEQDYYAFSMRSAVFKSDDVAYDLWQAMERDPEMRPT